MSKKMRSLIIGLAVFFIFVSVVLLFAVNGNNKNVDASEEKKPSTENGFCRLELTVKNNADQPVPGTAFEVYYAGSLIDTIVSGEDGIATSKPLKPCKYTYRMVKCNNYYNLDNELYTVNLDCDKNIEFDLVFTGYKISLNSICESGEPVTKGILYGIYNSDNELITYIPPYIDGKCSLSGLTPGGYTLKLESNPYGLDIQNEIVLVITDRNFDFIFTFYEDKIEVKQVLEEIKYTSLQTE